MNNIFFFQTQQIPAASTIFDQLKQEKSFFSYFQVDNNYYLFLYSQQSIDPNFIFQSVDIIQELDSKQRKIRSLRGFFLYALEILENGTDYEIVETNLQPFFWRKVKNIIQQNKKGALLQFLFGSDIKTNDENFILETKIENLQNQIDSLHDQLESNLEYALREPYRPKNSTSTAKLDTTTLNQKNEDFISPSQISEEERVEIIKKGFQLQAEGKISLKKYYESTDSNSLFQLKGYRIKYEAIRKNKFYQQLKQ